MENHQQQWNNCLQQIRQFVGPHVYDVWFIGIRLSHYDEAQGTLTLSVPSNYVKEYIEECRFSLFTKVLHANFKTVNKLYYKMPRQTSATTPREPLAPSPQRTFLSIPNAKERLRSELQKAFGDKMKWLSGYDAIADWLTDNKGKGLLCIGTPGLGKTFICQHILPTFLQEEDLVYCQATDMGQRIDELLKARCVIIDDLGKDTSLEECVKSVNGTFRKRTPFYELCNAAEQRGILLIITTNFSTTPVSDPRYPKSIQIRYGKEVYSRLRAMMKCALIEGNDMRSEFQSTSNF